jgi:hypothetical protein
VIYEQPEKGYVNPRFAYSTVSGQSEGCRYDPNRLWKDKEEVLGSVGCRDKIFICGRETVLSGVW